MSNDHTPVTSNDRTPSRVSDALSSLQGRPAMSHPAAPTFVLFYEDIDQRVMELHQTIGPSWTTIADQLDTTPSRVKSRYDFLTMIATASTNGDASTTMNAWQPPAKPRNKVGPARGASSSGAAKPQQPTETNSTTATDAPRRSAIPSRQVDSTDSRDHGKQRKSPNGKAPREIQPTTTATTGETTTRPVKATTEETTTRPVKATTEETTTRSRVAVAATTKGPQPPRTTRDTTTRSALTSPTAPTDTCETLPQSVMGLSPYDILTLFRPPKGYAFSETQVDHRDMLREREGEQER